MNETIAPVRPGWILISLASALTLIAFSLNFTKGMFEVSGPYAVSHSLGAALAPIIMALIVMGLFQTGRRFRNRRSRLKIYSWSLVALIIITLLQALQVIISALLGG